MPPVLSLHHHDEGYLEVLSRLRDSSLCASLLSWRLLLVWGARTVV